MRVVEVDRARDRAVTEKHIYLAREIRAERRFDGVKSGCYRVRSTYPIEQSSALTYLSSLKNRF